MKILKSYRNFRNERNFIILKIIKIWKCRKFSKKFKGLLIHCHLSILKDNQEIHRTLLTIV